MKNHSTPSRKCLLCKSPFQGRSDKKFCSIRCKSKYAQKLIKVTNDATRDIDKILHRNRSILLEIMGKKKMKVKVPRDILDKKKFNYSFLTHYHVNKYGKTVHFVYDFGWTIFSDQEILIHRNNL